MSPVPFFSVVIPCYNYGRYLPRAIESCLAQTDTDCEIVVVDDGSTDDTRAAAAQFGDRVRYFRHENCGVAASRNRGAELARGRYLVFLDADDRLLPSALERFRAAIEVPPEPSVVFGHHFSTEASGRREARPQPRLRGNEQNFLDFLNRRFGIVHGAIAMKREIFNQLAYPIGITNGEDLVLFAQCLLLFPCRTFPAAVAEIHGHEGRARDNVDAIERTGLKTVDALFRPDLLPPEAMRYRPLFASRRCLSIARSCYRAGRYASARRWYRTAARHRWQSLCDATHLARFVKSCLMRPPRQVESAQPA